jgi:hypothetical protein
MSDPDRLFGEYRHLLNVELAALDCALRISDDDPGDEEIIVLVDGRGVEVGRLPDHADAAIIAAVAAIIADADRRGPKDR